MSVMNKMTSKDRFKSNPGALKYWINEDDCDKDRSPGVLNFLNVHD